MKPLKTALVLLALLWASCHTAQYTTRRANSELPPQYEKYVADSSNVATIDWHTFFSDSLLTRLIDTALSHNQELNIYTQDLVIAQNETKEKRGEYLPQVALGAGAETSPNSENSAAGATEKWIAQQIGKQPNADIKLGAQMSWELDVWKKLRNAASAAELRYRAQNEGKNLLQTWLIAEIAHNYYYLMALDNSMKILDENIKIQNEAYEKMKLLKENAKANQLAVNRFEAQLLNTKNQIFDIQQKIVATENRIKFLSGNYACKLPRNSSQLMETKVAMLSTGVPAKLLDNRPDIRQASYAIQATALDLKSTRAALYPNVHIKAGIGYSAFDPSLLIHPQSLIYNIAGDLVAPLINRNALIARLNIAQAHQVQAVLAYEQSIVQAYTEVLNQLAKMDNAQKSLDTKMKEVRILKASVDIANNLFRYAKADYVEVLLTQEEQLKAEMEWVETQLALMDAQIDLYRALGGGWH